MTHDRRLAGIQARQAQRMRAAQESRARGDCQRCGHLADTRETNEQAACDWTDKHKRRT